MLKCSYPWDVDKEQGTVTHKPDEMTSRVNRSAESLDVKSMGSHDGSVLMMGRKGLDANFDSVQRFLRLMP